MGWRARLGEINRRLQARGSTYMVCLAAIVGLLAGLGAVGFRLLIDLFQGLFWEGGIPTVAWVESLPIYVVIGAPAVGGLIVGLLVHYGAPEAKGHGVPEVMEAIALRGGRIRPRVVAVKTLASGVCIASGGSVGREGPIVQIGASLASSIGQLLGLGRRRLRTLAGCGAAAGIAATFNAPIAGALFAVEVLLRDMRLSQFSPLVVAAVVATAISRETLGNVPAFVIPQYSLHSPWELAIYVVLGLAAGVAAFTFVRTLYFAEDRLGALPIWPPLLTALGGAALGGLALLHPEVLGNGYESIERALLHAPPWTWLAAIALFKIVAVSLTLGTGGSGGVFAPSLVIGGMLGGLVGVGAESLFPGAVAPEGAYALVGMGAVVAATTHAPLSAIIILFELTGDYRIILPLMIACTLATVLVTWRSQESIYTLKLLRRGVNLHKGKDANVLKEVAVGKVMRPLGVTVDAETPALELIAKMAAVHQPAYLVTGKEGRPAGIVTLDALRPIMGNAEAAAGLIADELAGPIGLLLDPADTLDEALTRMQDTHVPVWPVGTEGDVEGWVHLEDVLTAYRGEVFKRDMVQGMSDAFGASDHSFHAVGDVIVRECEVPHRGSGRTIGELDLRRRYGVTVLVVKRLVEGTEEIGVPDADTTLAAGDRLLVLGKERDILRVFAD